MTFFNDPPLHDFPDRAIRKLQAIPAHLRELVQAVAPALAARLDFERRTELKRDFPLPDWRRRETDLLFHVPFRAGEPADETLLCLLIEHQSAEDPPAPLRTLWYAVLYWERQWRAWADDHQRGDPLRLCPVLPILLHTGNEPWTAARGLRELMTGPAELHAHVPDWRPLFFDLAERTPESLLASMGAWLPALAVVRAEEDERERFQAVLTEVLRKLTTIHDAEPLRWHELLDFVLSWGLRRRPRAERQTVYDAVLASQQQAELRQEMEQMAHTLGQTWEQEMLAQGCAGQGRRPHSGEGRRQSRRQSRSSARVSAERRSETPGRTSRGHHRRPGSDQRSGAPDADDRGHPRRAHLVGVAGHSVKPMKYGLLFLLCGLYLLTLAVVLGDWHLVWLWPGLSFTLVGSAYFVVGPAIFGKRSDGRLAWWAVLLLFPYLALSWLVWTGFRYLTNEPCCNEVAPGIWLGRRAFAQELPPGIDLVVDLCAEFPESCAVVQTGTYLCLPTLDNSASDEGRFREVVARIAAWPGKVYIHCALGHGRSAAVAAAMLIAKGLAANAADAEKILRQARPAVRLKPAQKRLVQDFAAS